ncbi:tRNA (guanine-N7-)-methyltransferase [Clostridium tetanomorphum]|uniref:tRNA (guanine-N(7)-)-methyltransferase n=1 Tax=Clostridium tetanomorphum TaxID=1553 RepID=A0A923EAI4_CLOTT|nr:tRNA (guanosine(46)-N7)-methyltransferase TrmB [Clostridium tetanomorphum]KAJ51814.1 tRNA (guanine-N(7)-)-methyltransferase [Clostridium tetanomorphum DSM 665]MBC2397696.1 tRNA (guanosine(46)-N7)-methyltransferase TrmB [Clostridium tetanomorphum]MBP1865050.1 tRNA (guanine-N7-)-methyltransferase [Clostridium tetanomorphum]NRS83352.1 tRNA (guanine-N7-)-methyltransferase [Clostridium tetanomorphum]NRZ96552.1 tRNA (guanine-N7-)-methyltransferase [Clostridium tetanomorphum]
MRLRKKWWARPEMEEAQLCITNPRDFKGRWKEEFKNNNPIHLELGCGRGGFISKKADANRNVNYVAIDLKDEVLIYALRKVQELELTNVRIAPLNITFIAELFEKDEVEKIYINFCNPWPKDRHNKRRLTHTKFLTEYKKFLKPESEIWFKTDDIDLFEDSQEYFKQCGFSIEYLTYDLHNSGFDKNIVTEYEAKFTSMGMKTMFLIAKLL